MSKKTDIEMAEQLLKRITAAATTFHTFEGRTTIIQESKAQQQMSEWDRKREARRMEVEVNKAKYPVKDVWGETLKVAFAEYCGDGYYTVYSTLRTDDPNISITDLEEFASTCSTWTEIPDHVWAKDGKFYVTSSQAENFDYAYETLNEVAGIINGDDTEEFFYCENVDAPDWFEESMDGIHGQEFYELRKAWRHCDSEAIHNAEMILEPFFDREKFAAMLIETRRITEAALLTDAITKPQVHNFICELLDCTYWKQTYIGKGEDRINVNPQDPAVRSFIEVK